VEFKLEIKDRGIRNEKRRAADLASDMSDNTDHERGSGVCAAARDGTTSHDSQAGVPPLMRFTGTAQDINGNPLTGLVDITYLHISAIQTARSASLGSSPLSLIHEREERRANYACKACCGMANERE